MRTFRKLVNSPAGTFVTMLVIVASVHSFSEPYNYLYALEVERAKEAQIRETARKMNVDPEFLLNPQGRRWCDFITLFDWVSSALGFQAASTVAANDQPEDVKAQIARVKSRYALVAADTTLAKLAELLEVSLSPENVREMKKGQIKAELNSVLRLVEKDFLPKPMEGLPGSAMSRNTQMRVAVGKLRQDVKAVLNAPHALDEKNLDATLAKLRDTIGGSLKLKNNGQPRWTKDPFPVKDSYKQAQKTSTGPRYGEATGTASDANATTPAVVANAAAPAPNAPRVTSNAVSSDVAALAAQLGTPAKAFGFVYDNVDFEAYSGVGKGARGALLERRGNDWDQALLLRDLLIAQGYQAQLEWGKVELPIARAMNLVGTEDPMQAANLLATAGYDSVALTQNGTPIVVRLTHAWVRAFIPYIPNRGTTGGTPDTWVRMDPSFKRYEYQAGLDINVPWNENEYLQTSAVRPPNDFYADKVWAYIRANNLNCNNLSQVAKTGRVKAANFPFVPATLNARIESLSGLAAQPPASMMQTVSISVTDPYFGDTMASYSANFADLWGKKLSIAFPPATADDAATIARYGGIYNTPAYLVRLKAVISIDDVPVAEGGSVAAGADLGVDLSFREPNLGTDYAHHEITAGETMTEVFDTGRTPDALIAERMERLKAIAAQPAGEARDTALLTEKLSLVGMRYFQHVDDSFDFATGTRWHRWVKSTFEGLVSQRVTTVYNFIGQAVRIAPGDRNIDVTRLVVGIIPIQSDTSERLNTMALAGLQTSYLEGSIWEEMEAQQGISATKALLLSRMAGQTIRTADRGNVEAVLAATNLSAATEANIRGAVNQGRIAIVPSANIRVNKWVGTGYILRDPVGGSATYPISGGFAGGSSTGSGTSGTKDTMGYESFMGNSIFADLVERLRWFYDILGSVAMGPSTTQSDPVNMATGNMYRTDTDIALLAQGIPVGVARTYNSRSSFNGELGYGWTHSYGETLTPNADGSVTYREYDGTEHVFAKVNGVFVSPAGRYADLTTNGSGWTMQLKDGMRFTFDAQGRLATQSDLNGNTVTINRNAAGNPTSIVDAAGRTALTFTIANGKIAEITDAANRKVVYAYDGDDLVSVTDQDGKVTTLSYDLTNNLTELRDPAGATQSYDYDADDRLMHHVDANGNEEFFHYDIAGRQSVVTDRRGGERLIGYDTLGRGLTEVDPAGNMIRATFDEQNNLVSAVDSRGGETIREFDAQGNLTRQVTPDGAVTTKTYGAWARPTQITDADGNVTSTDYDANGNLMQVTRTIAGSVAVTRHTYDSHGQVVSTTDPLGNVTTMTWSDSGVPVTRTDAAGTVTMTPDAVGRIISVKDSAGHETKLTYDAKDRVVTATDPHGNVSTYTYDSVGRRLTATNSLGTSRWTYDAEGRVLTETNALGAKQTSVYDPEGLLISRTDPKGNTTRWEYDGAGRISRLTDPTGKVWLYGYCAAVGTGSCNTCGSPGGGGAWCEITDPEGNLTKREFDMMGRVVSVTDSLSNTARNVYDKMGRLTLATDAKGGATAYEYDEAGRLLEVTEATGAVSTYTYDAAGNRLSHKDANGSTWSYQYDESNRLIQETDPLGRKTAYTYDALGNLLTKTDAKAQTIAFTYDVRRLTAVTYPNGTSETFTYDTIGRRTAMANAASSFTYEHDALGRVTKVVNTKFDNTTISYEYDANGNRRSMTTLKGKVTYTYDAKDRLTTMTDPTFGNFKFAYDDRDRRTELVYPNGVKTSYDYDKAQRMTGIVTKDALGTVVDAWTYQFDAVGNRTSKTDMNGLSETYRFDAGDRLTDVNYADSSFERFSYDPVGNRRSLTSSTGTTNYTYDAANQMLTAGSEAYTYDANGNVATKTASNGVTNYTWDFNDRLTRIAGPEGTEVSSYSSDGRRSEVQSPAVEGTVRTQYDLDGRPLIDLTTSNGIWIYRAYGPGLDEPLAEQRSNGQVTYLHRDGLGSVTAVTGTSGVVNYRQSYRANGQMTRTNVSGSAVPTRLGFTGRENSIGSLTQHRARYYDSNVGRFLSQDPMRGQLSSPPSLHRYAYVLGNPVTWVDPTGYGDADPYPGPASGKDCATLIASITWLVGDINKRMSELIPNSLPDFGPMSMWGHVTQILDRQARLAVHTAEYWKRCGGPPPSAPAYNWKAVDSALQEDPFGKAFPYLIAMLIIAIIIIVLIAVAIWYLWPAIVAILAEMPAWAPALAFA